MGHNSAPAPDGPVPSYSEKGMSTGVPEAGAEEKKGGSIGSAGIRHEKAHYIHDVLKRIFAFFFFFFLKYDHCPVYHKGTNPGFGV